MVNSLKNCWNKIWIGSNIDNELIYKVWVEIETAYSQKNRHYHKLDHISKMISSSMIYASKIEDLNTLQLAIFYHDFVYSAKRKDNEEKSASKAVEILLDLQYPINLIEKCKQYILSSKTHTNLLNNNDLNYLLDFDLEILAAPWPDYEQYTFQIRMEYKIYPDILYKPGRKKVLEHFLKLESIYKTAEFSDKYEVMARQNLKNELEMLQ